MGAPGALERALAVRLRDCFFSATLFAALGLAATIVVLLIAAQAAYMEGSASPFSALSEGDVQAAIELSLWTSTLAAMLALFVAVPSAYALSRRAFAGRVLVDALIDLPVVLSPVVIGIALILLFRSAPGQWIEEHAIRFVFEVPGIVAAQFVLSLAIEVRVLKAGFDALNPRYEQVARTLGCTPFSAFWRVTLPMCRPNLLAAFVLGWCRAIGDFGATVTIAGAVRQKTETIPMAIYNHLASVRIQKALALAILLTMFAFFALVLLRLFAAGRKP
jgi:molybdate transport system permease protein